jgi:hypothetical protein
LRRYEYWVRHCDGVSDATTEMVVIGAFSVISCNLTIAIENKGHTPAIDTAVLTDINVDLRTPHSVLKQKSKLPVTS